MALLLFLVKILHQIFLVTLSYIFASKPRWFSPSVGSTVHTSQYGVSVSRGLVCGAGYCRGPTAMKWRPWWRLHHWGGAGGGPTVTAAWRHTSPPSCARPIHAPTRHGGQVWHRGYHQPYSGKVPITNCLHVKSSSKQAVGLRLICINRHLGFG